MSSGQAKDQDDQKYTEWLHKKSRLAIVAKHISTTDPDSQQGRDLEWIFENKDKILRNKQLINLLG